MTPSALHPILGTTTTSFQFHSVSLPPAMFAQNNTEVSNSIFKGQKSKISLPAKFKNQTELYQCLQNQSVSAEFLFLNSTIVELF